MSSIASSWRRRSLLSCAASKRSSASRRAIARWSWLDSVVRVFVMPLSYGTVNGSFPRFSGAVTGSVSPLGVQPQSAREGNRISLSAVRGRRRDSPQSASCGDGAGAGVSRSPLVPPRPDAAAPVHHVAQRAQVGVTGVPARYRSAKVGVPHGVKVSPHASLLRRRDNNLGSA